MATPTTFAANTTNLTATLDFIVSTVKHVVSTYNGDPTRVVLAGFSRGAIGVNYLGLANDAIAALWCASIAYTHYDGQPEDAQRPYPDPGPPASYQVPPPMTHCSTPPSCNSRTPQPMPSCMSPPPLPSPPSMHVPFRTPLLPRSDWQGWAPDHSTLFRS
jgi:hypothetical protein